VALAVVIGIVLFFMYGRRRSGSEEKTGNGDKTITSSIGASSENEKGGISPVIESVGASNGSNVMEQESTDRSKPVQSMDTQTVRQSPGPSEPQSERAERFRRLVSVFQQKGATSPEKAMTAQELGLPPRFEEYMDNRSGQTRIFVEMNGKYYLDQKALEEMRQRMASRRSKP
jgi:hypothetical protein